MEGGREEGKGERERESNISHMQIARSLGTFGIITRDISAALKYITMHFIETLVVSAL